MLLVLGVAQTRRVSVFHRFLWLLYNFVHFLLDLLITCGLYGRRDYFQSHGKTTKAQD